MLNNRYSAAAVEYAFSEVGLTSHGKLNEMPDFFGNGAGVSELCGFHVLHPGMPLPPMNWKPFSGGSRPQRLGHWADTFLDAVAEDARSSFWRVWAKTLKRKLAQFFAGI
ncbi:MAG: hypothetical protein V8R49_05400 [Duodenibacillus massiliensis]